VDPPTALTIQAGRPEKSLATRQSPEVVRMSARPSWPKALPLVIDVVLGQVAPAGFQSDDLDALLASSLASTPPPAPVPMTTTTLSSFSSNFAAMSCAPPQIQLMSSKPRSM
jgi:hypothetical protein